VFPENRESNKLRLIIYIARFLLLVRDPKPLGPLPHSEPILFSVENSILHSPKELHGVCNPFPHKFSSQVFIQLREVIHLVKNIPYYLGSFDTNYIVFRNVEISK
jgi:hypothetical protein